MRQKPRVFGGAEKIVPGGKEVCSAGLAARHTASA